METELLEVSSVQNEPNVSNLNYEQNNIVLPDSIDLDWAQIIYAICYKRIIFINCSKTWSSFHTENVDAYLDYTPEELCQRFLRRVLPNIYEYELSEAELHLLNVLSLHPNFLKTNSGFKIREETVKLTFPLNEAAIENLIAHRQFENENNFKGTDVKSNRHIITGPFEQAKFNFNAENAALLSVALCSDEELANCELLPIEEMHKLLKAAKSQFEKNGQQLENVNISLDDLVRKMEIISKLKEAVRKIFLSANIYEN